MTSAESLSEVLASALAADLPSALGPLRGQRLYALCLGTDSDPMTIIPMAHTEELLASLVAEDPEDDDDGYYRWVWSEWVDGGLTTPSVDAVVAQLDAVRGDPAPGGERARATACFRAMIDALGDPRVMAAVRSVDPDWEPVLYLQSSDPGGVDAQLGLASVDLLNPDHPRDDLVRQVRDLMSESV